MKGIGPRRAESLRATLANMLGRVRGRKNSVTRVPDVDLLLDVDEEYREKSQAGDLPTIAPRRFNPQNEPWLPVLHTRRGAWHFTALYSNSPRAHQLGRTRDWVVTYFYDDDHREGQCTVVTENKGILFGQRVIRGRESECLAYYSRRRAANNSAQTGSTGFLPFSP